MSTASFMVTLDVPSPDDNTTVMVEVYFDAENGLSDEYYKLKSISAFANALNNLNGLHNAKVMDITVLSEGEADEEVAKPLCAECEAELDAEDAWGGLCHDCDNQIELGEVD